MFASQKYWPCCAWFVSSFCYSSSMRYNCPGHNVHVFQEKNRAGRTLNMIPLSKVRSLNTITPCHTWAYVWCAIFFNPGQNEKRKMDICAAFELQMLKITFYASERENKKVYEVYWRVFALLSGIEIFSVIHIWSRKYSLAIPFFSLDHYTACAQCCTVHNYNFLPGIFL